VLDSAQRIAVADPYRAFNAVLKQGADKRTELRRRMVSRRMMMQRGL